MSFFFFYTLMFLIEHSQFFSNLECLLSEFFISVDYYNLNQETLFIHASKDGVSAKLSAPKWLISQPLSYRCPSRYIINTLIKNGII